MSELDYPGYESSEVSAREVIEILRRRWWTIVATLAIFVALAAILTPRMTPIYRARATMLIEQSPVRSASKAEDEGPLGDVMLPAQPHQVDTQVEVLQSGPLQEKVWEKIGPLPPHSLLSLTAAEVSKTDIIEVVAESTSPQVARDAANTLVGEYIQQTEDNKLAAIRKARTYVESKLKEAEEQLAQADARLRSFKEQHHLPDLTSNMANAISAANSLGDELRKSQNDVTRLASQIQLLRSQIAVEPPKVQAAHTSIPNPQIDRLQTEIRKLELDRITLLRTLKATEPEVREVDAKARRLKDDLVRLPSTVSTGETWQPNPRRAALLTQLDGLEEQQQGLRPQVARLREQYQRAQDQLRAFPASETSLAQLQRERDHTQDNQNALSTQLRTLRIREQAQGVSARPLTPAASPRAPVRPQPLLNFLVAMALGLVFGVGAACLREMTDDRLYTAEEAERLLDLPILGRVPTFPRRTPMLIPTQGESPVKDSYRRLRSGITFATQSDPVQSLMVTSATAGEGKSTTAANLAMAAALQGRRVILVDADLRGPSLSRLFGVPVEPGLSEVLLGETAVADALLPTGFRNLRLLPAGAPIENAAELLAGPRMGELVKELSSLADLVIVDTPPCLPVADAEVLGARVDAAVLVVGLGRTDKEAVRMARELLDQAHIRVLGTVMNRIKMGDRGYYYRYRYPYRTPRNGAQLPVRVPTERVDALSPGNGHTDPGTASRAAVVTAPERLEREESQA
jgi:succinoglycan biosynthesis transport protein ExoP